MIFIGLAALAVFAVIVIFVGGALLGGKNSASSVRRGCGCLVILVAGALAFLYWGTRFGWPQLAYMPATPRLSTEGPRSVPTDTPPLLAGTPSRQVRTSETRSVAAEAPFEGEHLQRPDRRSPQPIVDRTFMLGRWTDNGDCATALLFTPDGGFVTANGGTGLWQLEGDRLTMTGHDTLTIRVTPIDQNTITVINADGSLGRSTRR